MILVLYEFGGEYTMKFVQKYEQKETAKDHLTFTVTVDKAFWEKSVEDAIIANGKEITIKGFRKGKAPLHLLKNKVDMIAVYDDATKAVINPVLKEVIEDSKVVPLIIPTFNPVSVTDEELVLEYKIILLPDIKLGKYKGLGIEKKKATVNKEEIDHAIEHLREHTAQLNVVSRAAKLNDTTVIDFKGYLGKKAFEGGEAKNHTLKLGSGSFIPGFEEQVVGHKAGDEFDVNVTFPEQYHSEELKGQAVTFKVVLHEVKEESLPELNDEFAKSQNIPNVVTLPELRKHQEVELLQKAETEAKNETMGKILDKIVETSEIPVYEEYIERVMNDDVNRYTKQIQEQIGGTLEDYLKATNTTEEDFLASLHKNAVRQYEIGLVINKIVNNEKLIVTDADVDAELAKMAATYNMELEQIKQILAPQIDQFRNDLINKKLEDFLLSNN